ncbi:MAG: hypothetical protein KAI47_11290 [Deltaproteobacteria bacterium]|nr:hypothetical protein [Deltaproteobacteria bacterium]
MPSSKPGKTGSCSAKPSAPLTPAQSQALADRIAKQQSWLGQREALLVGKLAKLSEDERRRRMADAKDAYFAKKGVPQ